METFTDAKFQFSSDSFPSSAAFDAINDSLKSNDADRKDAVKKGNAIFAFTLKNGSGESESWYIDLKEKGEVAKGEAPEGKKANGMSYYPDPVSDMGRVTAIFAQLGLLHFIHVGHLLTWKK